MTNRLTTTLLALLLLPSIVLAQKPASFQITLPGPPFGVVASRDQQWVFVSLSSGGGQGSGIAVLHNQDGNLKIERTVPVRHPLAGIVLTHDDSMLIAAAGNTVVFLDTRRLETGQGDAAFQWVSDGPQAASVYVNITADDKTLFVSDEAMQAVTVMNLDRLRAHGRDSSVNLARVNTPQGAQDAIVGKIPVGLGPVALLLSQDQQWLFSTSEIAPPEWGWPSVLDAEGRQPSRGKVPEGAVIVVDVATARTNPPQSVVARVPAGGSPVRMALSPDGGRLFVSARNSNAALVFEVADLVKRPFRAKLVKAPVGTSPVPIILVADGKYALVGNSDRFGNDPAKASFLTVLDTSLIGTGKDAKLGEIPCGAFPREFHLAADGKTLYLTNFRSDTLQVIDVPASSNS